MIKVTSNNNGKGTVRNSICFSGSKEDLMEEYKAVVRGFIAMLLENGFTGDNAKEFALALAREAVYGGES